MGEKRKVASAIYPNSNNSNKNRVYIQILVKIYIQYDIILIINIIRIGMKQKVVTFRISENLYKELQLKVRNVSRFLRQSIINKISEEK